MVYIKGCKNVAADALSRLPSEAVGFAAIEESYAVRELDRPFILDYKYIAAEQQEDEELKALLQAKNKERFVKIPRGDVVTWDIKDPLDGDKPKTYIPNALRKELLEWFH